MKTSATINANDVMTNMAAYYATGDPTQQNVPIRYFIFLTLMSDLSTGDRVQYGFAISDGTVYSRSYNGSNWTAWQRLDNFGCSTPADLASLLGVPVLLSGGGTESSPFRLICKFSKNKVAKAVLLISYLKAQYQNKDNNFTHIATISYRLDSLSVGNQLVFDEMSEVGSSKFYIYDDGSNINVYYFFPNYGDRCYLSIISNENCDFSQFYATTSLTPQSEGVYRQ